MMMMSKTKTRSLWLVLPLVCASTVLAAGVQKKNKKASQPGDGASHAIKLKIKELDLTKEQLTIALANASKPPAPNLYRFTDDRDRHYIAVDSTCAEPDAAGERICRLALPSGYGRHRLKTVELHIGGLHGRLIGVDPKDVAAAWDDAQTRAQLGIPAPPTENPDGGVAGEGLLIPVGVY
jgi:hypothetical protein